MQSMHNIRNKQIRRNYNILCRYMFMCAMDWRRAGGQPLLRIDVNGFFFMEGLSHILKI